MDRIKHEADRYNRIYDDQSFAMGEGRYVDACGALSATMKHLKPAPQTLLDVGCGRGEMLDYALRHHFLAGKGTECAMQLVDGRRVEYALLPRLPFDDASFDIVLCLDVLEHLVPGEEVDALKELKRLARQAVIVSVNNKPSIWRGVDLHTNKLDYDHWHDLFCWHLSPSAKQLPVKGISPLWICLL